VGAVTDANGAIVQGANVLVKNERTGEERSAVTNESGYYIIASLRPSLYTVTASAHNLTLRLTNVQLLVGQELNLGLTLQPTGVEAKVDVTATGDTGLETGSASMNVNVNPREVEALPLNGRQLSQLYLQAPGSVNSGSGTFGDIRFSGRAVQQNVIRYDGIEGSAIIDASPGNLNGEVPSPFRLQSSLENVQEFRVDSNNFPAEFGTGTGGQVSVVTKSGGNAFHGSLFEYFRNDALDAANFFDNIIGQKAALRINQFGGSVGGPIVKDKFFFFFSYEGYRLRAGINSVEAVPGSASRLCAVPVGAGSINCNAVSVSLLPAFRAPNASIISTGSGSNLFDVAQLQANSSVNENSAALRLDYKINPKHSAYFRFFRDQGSNDQPEGVTGRRVLIKAVPQNGIVALQSLLTPTLLNEFKFGYNGAYTRINGVAPTVAGFDLSSLVINISGNTANFALPGQGTSAGAATPGGLVRANSATNGRGQPYTPYSLSFVDNLKLDQRQSQLQVWRRAQTHSPVYRSPGRDDLHLLEPDQLPDEHATVYSVSRRRERAEPLQRRRDRAALCEAGVLHRLRRGRVEDQTEPDVELWSALRVLHAAARRSKSASALRHHEWHATSANRAGFQIFQEQLWPTHLADVVAEPERRRLLRRRSLGFPRRLRHLLWPGPNGRSDSTDRKRSHQLDLHQ